LDVVIKNWILITILFQVSEGFVSGEVLTVTIFSVNFDDFFTRRLKQNARVLAKGVIVPADGRYLLNALSHGSGLDPQPERTGAAFSPGGHQQPEFFDA